jgi:glycosyltransferase involved in cell wall biosynthesis
MHSAVAQGRRERQTISVALCTFEGERYLSEQLESIASQVRPPDEIVLCDDRSSDGTVRVVRDFAARANVPVRVEVNERRLGTTKNFEKAISLCRGDLIALCDQDDVWMPRKLSILEAALAAAPDAGLAFSDAEVVDEDLKPLGYRFWKSIRLGERELMLIDEGRAFELLLRRTVVAGATSVFRASHRDAIIPMPASWVHDAWIALILSATSRIVAASTPLMKYRQHAASQIGGRRRSTFENATRSLAAGVKAYERAAEQFEEARERLGGSPDAIAVEHRALYLRLLDEKIAHMRRRARMPGRGPRRLPILAEELLSGRYHRYSNGMRSFWRDVLGSPRAETENS